MYIRKTTTAAELSEARRRASLSRKVCRGGRPKGVRKNPDGLPVKTIAEVFQKVLEQMENYKRYHAE